MKIYYPKFIKGIFPHFFAISAPYFVPILLIILCTYILTLFNFTPMGLAMIIAMYFGYTWKCYLLTALVVVSFRSYFEKYPKSVLNLTFVVLLSYYFIFYPRIISNAHLSLLRLSILISSFVLISAWMASYYYFLKKFLVKNNQQPSNNSDC